MSVVRWLRAILLPVMALIGGACCAGMLPRLFLPTSFLRLALTTGLCELVLLPLVWFLILSACERAAVRKKWVELRG